MTDARVFRGFRFPAEVILWAVRWYLQFPVSYRDLELMLADRGVTVRSRLVVGADVAFVRRRCVQRDIFPIASLLLPDS
jgi:transposase-like protein